MDNTSRFDGLADIYDASRPDYPAEAIAAIRARASAVSVPKRALDIGAGTGISTRAIANALPDWDVLAVEPNADMARAARASLASLPNVVVEHGTAETLPAADATCGLVAVAQALHWFDRPVFFAEARRALARGGVLAILNNNRRTADSPALLAVEDFFEVENPDYSRNYRSFDIFDELACAPGFAAVEQTVHAWQRQVTSDSLADYFLSRSSAKPIVQRLGLATTRTKIVDLIAAAAGTKPFHIAIDCEVIAASAA